MRDSKSLYFDMWRKKDFQNLIRVYTQTAATYHDLESMRIGLGEMLDRYMEDGRGKYEGKQKQWFTAYTLGRELGIFRRKIGEKYELSKLAKSFLDSKILAREYLLIYLLNLNQLINGKVVHPLYEVLTVIENNESTLSKNDILNIERLKISERTPANQRQIINIFIHRLLEAGIIETTETRDTFRLSNRYSLGSLLAACNILEKTPDEVRKMTHEDYVDMLSTPNQLIPHYE